MQAFTGLGTMPRQALGNQLAQQLGYEEESSGSDVDSDDDLSERSLRNRERSILSRLPAHQSLAASRIGALCLSGSSSQAWWECSEAAWLKQLIQTVDALNQSAWKPILPDTRLKDKVSRSVATAARQADCRRLVADALSTVESWLGQHMGARVQEQVRAVTRALEVSEGQPGP